MAHQLGRHQRNLQYDLTGDGKVNAKDLLVVVKCFILEKKKHMHGDDDDDDDKKGRGYQNQGSKNGRRD
jgi:hypothetical protein